MHGKTGGGKKSDYAKQLREKQKTRAIFGVSEKQIQRYYGAATASPEESGAEFLRQLERRFDNILFRCGFATTRRQARQLVSHGLFLLNGRRVSVPSIQLKEGDEFEVRGKNKSMPLFEKFEKRKATIPSWLRIDPVKFAGQVVAKPAKEDLEGLVDPTMIIEFYSR